SLSHTVQHHHNQLAIVSQPLFRIRCERCVRRRILVLHLCNTNAMLVFSEVISMRKNADSPGARIKRRRMELGLSVEDVAKALGKDRSTIYRYESDEIENMPVSVLVPLARILRTSPTWILGFDNPEPKTKRVPLLGDIAAGEPIFASEEYGEYVEVPGDAPVDFCLRVRGDSMVDARIQDGDLVFVRQQPTVENGEIAV